MDKEKFLQELSGLNDEQKEVVTSLDNNLIVLSPAGTGKTKTIGVRCANIILNGTNGSEIMCLTFTNKACNEMKNRIKAYLGKLGQDIYIKTFHSFCFDVVKSEAKRSTDISWDFLVFDEEDSKEVIKEINLKMYPSRILEGFIYEIKHFSITLPKDSRKNYELLVKEYFKNNLNVFKGKYFRRNDSPKVLKALINYGHILIKKYNGILTERHGLDFSDLVILCYELLEDVEILESWRKRYKYIQVDEVQDTSFLEYSIIRKISFGKNLSFFGDVNQTIYGWRGSRPFDIIKDFKEKFTPIKDISLKVNYRSTEVLLNASCSYLDKIRKIYLNQGIYVDEAKSKSNAPGDKIFYKKYETIEEEIKGICDIIEKKYMNSLDSIAILTRNNNLNKIYSEALEERGIPTFLVEEYKFFRRKEIKDFLSFLKLAVNKYDVNSMKRIAFEFVSNVGDKTIEYITKNENKNMGIRLTDFIEKSTIEFGDPYYILYEGLDEGNVIIFDVEATGVDITRDEIVQIAAIKLNKDGTYEEFERFLKPSLKVGTSEEVHGFSDEFLANNGGEPKKVLEEFLNFIEEGIIVGHNVQYDLTILKSQLTRLNMKPYNIKEYYDTLDMARRLLPNLANHKLSTLSEYIKVKIPPDHNAMNDILATKDVLIYMVNHSKENMLSRMGIISTYRKRFTSLYEVMEHIKSLINNNRPYEILDYIYDYYDVKNKYEGELSRLENLQELRRFFKENDNAELNPIDSLMKLLTLTALSNSEIDRAIDGDKRVPVITVHQGKGLEFKAVFLPSLNEGDFPSYFSKSQEEVIEECRLFYVAMTRAKENLYLTGYNMNNRRRKTGSRFLEYINQNYIEKR